MRGLEKNSEFEEYDGGEILASISRFFRGRIVAASLVLVSFSACSTTNSFEVERDEKGHVLEHGPRSCVPPIGCRCGDDGVWINSHEEKAVIGGRPLLCDPNLHRD